MSWARAHNRAAPKGKPKSVFNFDDLPKTEEQKRLSEMFSAASQILEAAQSDADAKSVGLARQPEETDEQLRDRIVARMRIQRAAPVARVGDPVSFAPLGVIDHLVKP